MFAGSANYTCGISYLFKTTVLNIKSYFIISFMQTVEKKSLSIVLHFVVFFIYIFKEYNKIYMYNLNFFQQPHVQTSQTANVYLSTRQAYSLLEQ